MTRLLTAGVATVIGLLLFTPSSHASQFDPDHPNVSVIRQPTGDDKPWDDFGVGPGGDDSGWNDPGMRVGPHGDDGGWGDIERMPIGDGDPWDEIKRVGPHGDDGGWGNTERMPTGDDTPWIDQIAAPRPGWYVMLDWLRGLITVGGSY